MAKATSYKVFQKDSGKLFISLKKGDYIPFLSEVETLKSDKTWRDRVTFGESKHGKYAYLTTAYTLLDL
jgi:hypothetical protein